MSTKRMKLDALDIIGITAFFISILFLITIWVSLLLQKQDIPSSISENIDAGFEPTSKQNIITVTDAGSETNDAQHDDSCVQQVDEHVDSSSIPIDSVLCYDPKHDMYMIVPACLSFCSPNTGTPCARFCKTPCNKMQED